MNEKPEASETKKTHVLWYIKITQNHGNKPWVIFRCLTQELSLPQKSKVSNDVFLYLAEVKQKSNQTNKHAPLYVCFIPRFPQNMAFRHFNL